jgi:hypothetical protein
VILKEEEKCYNKLQLQMANRLWAYRRISSVFLKQKNELIKRNQKLRNCISIMAMTDFKTNLCSEKELQKLNENIKEIAYTCPILF